MQWLELSTLVDREAVEAVSELFSRYAYGSGIVVEEPIIAEQGGDGYAVDLDRPVAVKAYVPLDEDAPAKQQRVAEGLWHLSRLRGVAPLAAKTLAEEDWANAWRAHYAVHRVGKRIIIKPSWQDYQPRPADVVVELDPGMAFGTGLHPTTQLCLRALEQLVRPGMRVLDVGTGSGILAIAAVMLGAKAARGLDVDSVAVSAARENVARNARQDAVAIHLGTLGQGEAPAERYDLVVANITARVIAELAGALAKALAPQGRLLLSGIIADQSATVRAALRRAGLRIVTRRKAGDWLAYVAEREADHRGVGSTEGVGDRE